MIAALTLLVGMFLGVKGHEYEASGRDAFWWVQAIVGIVILLVVGEVLT
jgi:uncharacterized membrane protein YhaH (DUF805 family)